MLESLNLIDIYEKKQLENLEIKEKEEIKKFLENDKVAKEYEKIIQKTKDLIQKLFMSQFSEEEKELKLKGVQLENNKTLVVYDELYIEVHNAYIECESIKIREIEEKYKRLMNELREKMKFIRAHLGIAKTKEEVEDILFKYNVIDDEGKIVINNDNN